MEVEVEDEIDDRCGSGRDDSDMAESQASGCNIFAKDWDSGTAQPQLYDQLPAQV